jgi:poly [ADP-ribose] polymerase
MFGKGVYFADMVSKSANYCSATSANPTAVLLLCDVALGQQVRNAPALVASAVPAP